MCVMSDVHRACTEFSVLGLFLEGTAVYVCRRMVRVNHCTAFMSLACPVSCFLQPNCGVNEGRTPFI